MVIILITGLKFLHIQRTTEKESFKANSKMAQEI